MSNSSGWEDWPNLVLAGPLCPEYGNKMQRKGRLEKMELLLDSVPVSQFCSDSPGPEGRGWRQLLVPLLFGAVLRLGRWKAGSQKEAVCASGSQPRQLRLMELGYRIYRGLRTLRACLCPCSCACTCRFFLIALVERQERRVIVENLSLTS